MDLSQAIDSLILAIIASVVSYLVKYGVIFAKEIIVKFKVETFVKAAEEIYTGKGLGDAKYQHVSDLLVEFAKTIHIKLDAAKIKTYIKAAVKDLHIAVDKELEKPTKEATTESTETK